LPAETFELRTTIGEATSVGFARRGHVVVQTREPATLQILTAGREYIITLSKDSRFDTGHALFHSAPGFSGLACASCHPEGGDDGRIWTFEKIGARRTQTLRGGILATAPFHWDGGLRDLGHLMTEVFESRMRGPALSDKHVEALGRFLDKVPLVPPSKPQDEPAADRGRALFASQNCATCHIAGHTDSKTVNVGTGGGMQTPSLRGVVMRAPFMHNGCAGTLKDRFNPECGGGDKHGLTSRLTPAQISDLVAFMESL
jgi:cytochrome c peroxidase